MKADAICYYYVDPYTPAEVVITDEHAACSYGMPVVLVDGEPRGADELMAILHVDVDLDPALLCGLLRAGYTIRGSRGVP